ncbi:MAG TPA: FlgD immunoglobulin-like domain containing protein, partial [bacterium]
LPNLSVWVQGTGDSSVVMMGDTIRYAHANKQVRYRVTLTNLGEIACRTISVKNVLPDRVTLVSFPDGPYTQQNDTLTWSVDRIESRGATRVFTYSCKVDSLLPPWQMALVNRLSATCLQDADISNNIHVDTVWAVGVVPPDPQARVSPAAVEPQDSVTVEVMSPVNVKSWDVWIEYENHERITDYADAVISTTTLTPGQWIRLAPAFNDTRMRTAQNQENVAVIFETTDLWDVVRTDTVWFMLKSSDAFVLDRNLFNPRSDGLLVFRIKISSMRDASLSIYDIAGGYVKRIAEGRFDAGWSQFTWDGRNDRNEAVGSGVYMALLSSGSFKKVLKFIVIR